MAYLGIDPGTRNCGIAVISDDGTLLHSEVIDPDQGYDCLIDAVNHVKTVAIRCKCHTAGVERFVNHPSDTRDRFRSPNAEPILMLIGRLVQVLEELGIDVRLFRAVDWTRYLADRLKAARPDYDIPNTKAKQVAIDAAHLLLALSEKRPDHETDAMGIALYTRFVRGGQP